MYQTVFELSDDHHPVYWAFVLTDDLMDILKEHGIKSFYDRKLCHHAKIIDYQDQYLQLNEHLGTEVSLKIRSFLDSESAGVQIVSIEPVNFSIDTDLSYHVVVATQPEISAKIGNWWFKGKICISVLRDFEKQL